MLTSKNAGEKPSKSSKSSEQVLALSLRPRSFDDLIGQESIIKAIRNHVAKRPPRTWLFTGPPGSGKTTLAKIMARAFQCTHDSVFGSVCPICSKEKQDQYPIHEINAAKNGGMAELEKVVDLSKMRPIFGSKRVIIVDECHHIKQPVWSMLLKPTEDVPEFTVWIFATSEKSKIGSATLRRAIDYQLKGLKPETLIKFVTATALNAGITRDIKPFLEALEIMSINSPGVVLKALEKYAVGASVKESVASTESTLDTYRLCKAVTSGNWTIVRNILKDATPDEVRLIRGTVMGWLRGGLIKFDNPESAKNASGIMELSQIPFDEAVILSWLVAVLHKITMKFAK
jgi:replication-associated recombination protein RarA